MNARFLLPLVLFVGACSAADDTSSSANDLSIDPAGPGGDITVTFVVPDEVMRTSAAQNGRLHYSINNTNLTPNEPKRVAWNRNGQTAAIWFSATHGFESQKSFDVPQGGTLRIELGAFEVSGDIAAASTLGLAADPYVPSKALVRKETTGFVDDWKTPNGSSLTNDELKFQTLPAFPGSYEWRTNVGPARAFEVEAHRVAHVSEANDAFASVTLDGADVATLPDALSPQPFRLTCGAAYADGIIHRTLTVFTNTQTHCSFLLNGVQSPTFALDAREQKVVKLPRIDVANVTLTDEAPGTKVVGRWTLLSGAGLPLVEASTNTGIWVVPDVYTLRIEYQSLHGTQQRLEQTVDAR